MQILPHVHPHPHPHLHCLSSLNAFLPLSLLPKLSSLSLRRRPTTTTTTIRMGGGPRTYPGGVSKWQWKRMQAKKAKQLLKARLARERQIYEMRKRAELKAAIADLERPWELVQRAAPQSALFSVGADEQLKVLADRFQKPGAFDLWSEDDGPQLFETPDGLPTARFFPKGVVHSVKPYGRAVNGGRQLEEGDGSEEESGGVDNGPLEGVGSRNRRGRRNGIGRNSSGGYLSGRLGGGTFASDTQGPDDEGPFDSSVNLESSVGDGVWNGPNVRSVTRGKQRGSFRHSGGVDGSLSGVIRNKRGGRNGMTLRSQTRGGKLGNGSIAREIEKSSDENSDFSRSKPSYGGRRERYHRVVNNGRDSGTRIDGNGRKELYHVVNNRWDSGTTIDGNGPKLKDLGGRPTSSNTRNNGRQWSSRGGNRERFRHSHSEDEYGMTLRSQTRGGKLGNGSIAREIEKSSDENSDFSRSKPSYGGRREHYHRVVNNRRDSGTRIDGNGRKELYHVVNNRRDSGTTIDGNGPKLKDLGGRQTGSNRRNTGRQWSSRGGNRERFRHSHSEDEYDMSLQRDGSYGLSVRNKDAKLSPKSTITR